MQFPVYLNVWGASSFVPLPIWLQVVSAAACMYLVEQVILFFVFFQSLKRIRS